MYPQTTNPDEMHFHEQTDTFDLTATFNNNKLTITLKDFIDWTIYSKTYTEQDIGREINRRMDLIDVYTAFSQTQPQCDQENMKEKQENTTKLKIYQFGDIIENEKVPCYKIEREGKIAAYQTIMDIKTKKQLTHESKLILTKVRNMTETEILTQRSTKEKLWMFDELNKQIDKQKKEKQQLVKRIINLEQETTQLRQQLREVKQQLSSKIEEQINQANTQLITRITATKQQSMAKIKENNNQLNQLNQVLQIQNQRCLDKFTQLQKKLNTIRLAITYTNLQQTSSSYFKIEGLQVQFIGAVWTHYIFNLPIHHNKSAKYKFKVIRTQSRHIMFGVVDYSKQKDSKSSYCSGNAMCYYGYDCGYRYPQEAKQGGGFKQGDIVEVEANRSTSTVNYYINGSLKASHTNQMLNDGSRIFMPFVDMYSSGDIVQMLVG